MLPLEHIRVSKQSEQICRGHMILVDKHATRGQQHQDQGVTAPEHGLLAVLLKALRAVVPALMYGMWGNSADVPTTTCNRQDLTQLYNMNWYSASLGSCKYLRRSH